jgi:short subunit dehydrogenase
MLAEDVDAAAITREIAINLTAPILLVRRCLPLLQHGRRPLIVMVTSGYALLPVRRAPTYSATKAGLRAFTQALRYQLQDSGIRVIETLPPRRYPKHRWDRQAQDGTQSGGGCNLGVHRTRTPRVLRRAGSVAAVIDATGAPFRRTPDSQDLRRRRERGAECVSPAISMNIPLCNATLVFGPFVALSVVAPGLLSFDWGYPYCSSGLSSYPCQDMIPLNSRPSAPSGHAAYRARAASHPCP